MRRFTILSSTLLLLAACDSILGDPPSADSTPPPTVEDPPGFVDTPAELGVDPAMAAKAKVVWETRCASCHGPYGDGGGAAGEGLKTPPQDFHQRRWQAQAADDHIKRVILEGGAAAGLSPDMAAHLDLASQPAVLDQLVLLLRNLPHWRPAPAGSLDADGRPRRATDDVRPLSPSP